jgi:chromosomal replication initiation ATPase DnaA
MMAAVLRHWSFDLPPTVRALGERIAREHGKTFAALVSGTGTRSKTIALARHRWIAITKWTLGLSYPEAGRMFGLDHTTVISACKKIEALLAEEWRATP